MKALPFVKLQIYRTTQDMIWGIATFLLIFDGSPLYPTEAWKTPLMGFYREKGGKGLNSERRKRWKNSGEASFFAPTPPVFNGAWGDGRHGQIRGNDSLNTLEHLGVYLDA